VHLPVDYVPTQYAVTLQGTNGSTFMTKEVQDQPYIKSGHATDNPCTALLASSVKCVIGVSKNSNDQAIFTMVVVSRLIRLTFV